MLQLKNLKFRRLVEQFKINTSENGHVYGAAAIQAQSKAAQTARGNTSVGGAGCRTRL